eukprot:403364690
MNDNDSVTWRIFIPILGIVFSPHSQYILYQYLKLNYSDSLYPFSYFRLMLLIYLIPFLLSLVLLIYPISQKLYKEVNRSPLYLNMKQLTILSALTVFSVIGDFIALNSGTIQKFIQNANGVISNEEAISIDLDLSKYLMLKITMQSFFTILLGSLEYQRQWQWSKIGLLLFHIFGIFIYEFTTLQDSSQPMQMQSQYKVIYDFDESNFKIIVPISYYNSKGLDYNDLTPFFYQWLPFIMIFLTSLLNSTIIIYSKRSMIYQGYKNRLEFYQQQKMKLLKDSQLNIQNLDKDMSLKPRLINKSSMLFKRYEYLYENMSQPNNSDISTNINKSRYNLLEQEQEGIYKNPRSTKYALNAVQSKQQVQADKTKYFYKAFKGFEYMPKFARDIFQIKKKQNDPDSYGKALAQYKDNHIMNTEEEDNLFKLQKAREKELGIKTQKVNRLPDSGYSLQSQLQKIKNQQSEYSRFRGLILCNKKQLKRLDPLDEMALDMNNLLFHQHLFCEFNELEASQIDNWYSNQVYDLLAQDYCKIIGLSTQHSWFLACVTQYLLMFPALLFSEFFIFNNQEKWVRMPIDRLKRVNVVQIFGVFIADTLINTNNSVFTPIMQIIGFVIVIYGHLNLINFIEDNQKNKEKAQFIDIMKSKLAHRSTKEAQKIENQMMFINEEFDDITYQQAVQDVLLSQNSKALTNLAPSNLPHRKLFDPNYKKTTRDWGGGYQRPLIEMIDSTWRVDIKNYISLNPVTYVNLRPDLDMSDILQHKIRMNDFKKHQMLWQMKQMEQKKRQIEVGHQQMQDRVLHNEKNLYYDSNKQGPPNSQQKPRILPPIVQNQQKPQSNQLPQNIQLKPTPTQISPDQIKLQLDQKLAQNRQSLSGKIQTVLNPNRNSKSLDDRNKQAQLEKQKVQQLLKKMNNEYKQLPQSQEKFRASNGSLRTQKRQEFLDKYKPQDSVGNNKQKNKVDEKLSGYQNKFPEMVNMKANYYHQSKQNTKASTNQSSWISIKAHHFPQNKAKQLDFAYKSDEDTDHEVDKKSKKKETEFKLNGQKKR